MKFETVLDFYIYYLEILLKREKNHTKVVPFSEIANKVEVFNNSIEIVQGTHSNMLFSRSEFNYIKGNFTPYIQDLLLILLADRFCQTDSDYKIILSQISDRSIGKFKETIDKIQFNKLLEVI